MKLTIIILTSYFGLCIQLQGQMKKDALFTTETPLKIGLKFNIQAVAKTKSDSVYLSNWLQYQNNNGRTWEAWWPTLYSWNADHGPRHLGISGGRNDYPRARGGFSRVDSR